MKDEEGVTLIEIIAAIAILSIVVTAFLAFFVQAGRTNNMTNEMNEATFLAQEEMERVTALSNQKTRRSDVSDPVDKNGFTIVTEISEAPEDNSSLYKVVVEVDEKGGKGSAKMETRLPFAEAEE